MAVWLPLKDRKFVDFGKNNRIGKIDLMRHKLDIVANRIYSLCRLIFFKSLSILNNFFSIIRTIFCLKKNSLVISQLENKRND